MSNLKQQRFESAVAQLELRYGTRVLVRARELAPRPDAIPTGFAALDTALGIGGVPQRAITLLSGPGTAGKLTLAYKVLSHAQWPASAAQRQRLHPVAILDASASSDPDYLMRCGVDLERLLIVRPQHSRQAAEVLLDLARNRSLRAILVDSLAELSVAPDSARYFDAILPSLKQALQHTHCALLVLHEPQPFWRRWLQGPLSTAIHHHAALHLQLKHERWLERDDALVGYQAQARVARSQWTHARPSVSIAVEFNGIVRARRTW